MSVFGVFLVRIFPHLDWDTPYLSVFSQNAGKYGPEKLLIRTLFTQCLTPETKMSLTESLNFANSEKYEADYLETKSPKTMNKIRNLPCHKYRIKPINLWTCHKHVLGCLNTFWFLGEHRHFPVEFAEMLRTPFLQNTSGWLFMFTFIDMLCA